MRCRSVLVVDDHPVVLDGLHHLLDPEPDLEIVGTATRADDALTIARSAHPDIVVLDLNLRGCFAPHLVGLLSDASPSSKIVVHTAFDAPEPLQACIDAGAKAVIFKDASNLVEVLRRVADGETVIAEIAHQTRAKTFRFGRDGGIYEPLTPREYDVLCVMALGGTSREIGEELFLAENTVRSYIQAILRKFHATNRVEALAIARQQRLI